VSLKVKLSLFITALTLLPIVLLGGYQSYSRYRGQVGEARAALTDDLRDNVQMLRRFGAALGRDVEFLAQAAEIKNLLKGIASQDLDEISYWSESLDGVFRAFLANRGTFLALFVVVDPAAPPLVQAVLADDKSEGTQGLPPGLAEISRQEGPSAFWQTGGTPDLWLFQPVGQGQGKALLCARVKLAPWFSLISTPEFALADAAGRALVLDGKPVSGEAGAQEGTRFSPSPGDEQVQLVDSGASLVAATTLAPLGLPGEPRFIAYRSRDKALIMAPVFASLREVAIVCLVTSLLAVNMGYFWLAAVLIRPIMRATAVADAISAGDLQVECPPSTRRDEMGQLAAAMERMVETLRRKAQMADGIAAGNLAQEIVLASERDGLGQALQTMADQLNTLVGRIAGISERVDLGSRQLTQASDTLSQGVTESASSVEEIAASITLLIQQVQANADKAAQTQRLAKAAHDEVEQGNSQMRELTSCMETINSASANIARIIKVVDEIAFQTNLLALNAAVEAARAGQHGKGFAVVAEEVRNLAARSAKAAHETEDLIRNSVQLAQDGSAIARRTAGILGGILQRAAEMDRLVSEIAQDSGEQARGVAELQVGLSRIDETTQRSSAISEETAAAATELSRDAAHLSRLMGRFTLRRSGAPAALHSPASPPRRALPSRTEKTRA